MEPVIIVLAGYPGVGKSFVAEEFKRRLNAGVLRTDEIRKELFSNPTYSKDESEKTYNELFSRAESAVQNGSSVVLDATFNLKIGRDNVAEIGEEQNCEVIFVNVTCNESVVRERIASRNGISDADFSVYQKVRDSFEEFQRSTETVDNSGSKSETKRQVKQILNSYGY